MANKELVSIFVPRATRDRIKMKALKRKMTMQKLLDEFSKTK